MFAECIDESKLQPLKLICKHRGWRGPRGMTHGVVVRGRGNISWFMARRGRAFLLMTAGAARICLVRNMYLLDTRPPSRANSNFEGRRRSRRGGTGMVREPPGPAVGSNYGLKRGAIIFTGSRIKSGARSLALLPWEQRTFREGFAGSSCAIFCLFHAWPRIDFLDACN